MEKRKETTHHHQQKKFLHSTHFPILNTLLEASVSRGTADEVEIAKDPSSNQLLPSLLRYLHCWSVHVV